MAKEFRIEAAVMLPDDMFEQAEMIAALKPVMKHLVDGLTSAAKDAGRVSADCAVVVPKPRAPKDEPTLPLGATPEAAAPHPIRPAREHAA